MDIRKEIKDMESEHVAAKLAVAYALLAMAPFDTWDHEGGPAEMATYVVKMSKERGNFGFVSRMVLNESRYDIFNSAQG